MSGAYVSYGLLAILAIALLYAAFTDIRARRIDNWLNAAIALAAPAFWWACGLGLADIGWQLGTALAALVILAALFAMRVMGGGDVKLLAALALWIKPLWFGQLILVMAVVGGVLTVVFGAWHIALRHQHKPQIPYGIAIAVAGLWVLSCNYLPLVQAGQPLG